MREHTMNNTGWSIFWLLWLVSSVEVSLWTFEEKQTYSAGKKNHLELYDWGLN
jgi:hypothetical protein